MVRLAVLALVSLLVPACGVGGITLPDQPAPTTVSDADIAYNLAKINDFRTGRGLEALTQDAGLDTFAREASRQLAETNVPHGYFVAEHDAGRLFTEHAFDTLAGETQGAQAGWPAGPAQQQIDGIMDAMLAQETLYPPGDPRRVHFETIVNPDFTRLGIGLLKDPLGRLFFTNEFSD